MYKYIHVPDHPHANSTGFYYEHIVVMEKHLGRYLYKDETVHHIDLDKNNNDLSNLQLMKRKDHSALHAKLRGCSKTIKHCITCDKEFSVSSNKDQYRLQFYCSHNCSNISQRKVMKRPTLEQLENDLKSLSMVAVGKKYLVSDNTIRKWIKQWRGNSVG